MKIFKTKLLPIALVGSMALVMSGCGGSTAGDDNTNNPPFVPGDKEMTTAQAKDAMALNALFYPILSPISVCSNDIASCLGLTPLNIQGIGNNPMSDGDHNCTLGDPQSGQYTVVNRPLQADTPFSIEFGTGSIAPGECVDLNNGQNISEELMQPCIIKMLDLSDSASDLGVSSQGYNVRYEGKIICTKGQGAVLDNYVISAFGQSSTGSNKPNRNSYNATLDTTNGFVLNGTYQNEKWEPGDEPAEDKKINDETWTFNNLGLFYTKNGASSTIAANGSSNYVGIVRLGDEANNGMTLNIGFEQLTYILTGTTDLNVEVNGGVTASCHPEMITYATPTLMEDINATRDSMGARMPSDGEMTVAIPGYNPAPAVFSATATPTAQVDITSNEGTVNYASWKDITTTSSCATLQEIIDRFLNNI